MSGKWNIFNVGGALKMPTSPGVYVVIAAGKAIYVGQSTNLQHRISTYRIRRSYGNGESVLTPWGCFAVADGFSIKFKVSKRIGDWAMWEIRLIRKLRPEFNTTFAKMRRA